MEEFGGVLAEQFHKEEDHNKQNLMVGVSCGELDVGTMGIEFQRLIESAFKKTRPTLNVPPKPVWDAYLLGTDEEVFMQNITRFPSLNPNIDPDPDDDPYDDPMPDDEDLEDPNQKGGKTPNADSRRATSFSALRELKRNTYESSRRITMETASSALMATAQLQAAQLSPSHKIVPPSVTGVGNQGTVSTQLDDIHEDGIIRPENQETVSLLSHVRAANTSDAILEEQLTSVCVAMMRGFYVLLTDSSHKIRAECCKVLKNYETFAKLRALMLSCDYGIRKSILEPYIDENQLCVKFLQLMEELIEVEEPGTESSLRALELYEVFVCILSDVFARILQLLRSRNENTRDPLHSIRFLTREEERILCAASRCAALVIQAITQITFFPGTTSWIARGNRECRKKALMEFFVSSSVFAEGLKHLILYDLEASADLSYDSDDGVYVYMTPRPYRDEMRIAMHQIIGQLFIVEPAYKAEFIQRHQTSLVKANSSIRPSALHAIFAAEASLFFRDKLDEHLHGRGILSADELIVAHAFVDYGISKRSLSGGYRLLVITNRAYYVSHDNYDDLDAAIEWKSQYVDQYSHLQKREFADMQLIFRGLGDQIFAICRHSQPRAKRLSSETMPQELDVFVHPRLGVVDQLIRALSRAHRDDQNRTLPVVDETFTNESLKYLYRQFKLPNARANVYREHLYTHVLVRRSGSDYRQVLVWAHSDANDFIITSAYNIKLWDMQLNPSSFQTQDGISLLRARRGKRSDYAAYYSSGHVYDLSKIESVDFTENTDTHMILIFPGRSLHVCFQCDTARELWRREIKKYLFGKDDSPWKASILPANEALTAGQAVRLL